MKLHLNRQEKSWKSLVLLLSPTYHKNTLKNIRAALNCHFTDIGRQMDIVRDPAFKPANRILDWFMKEQAMTGKSLPTKRTFQNKELLHVTVLLTYKNGLFQGQNNYCVLMCRKTYQPT